MRYRIWFLYKGGRSHGPYMDDSGATQDAGSPEQALEDARRRGIGWGNGYDKTYVKAVALPEELTSDAF